MRGTLLIFTLISLSACQGGGSTPVAASSTVSPLSVSTSQAATPTPVPVVPTGKTLYVGSYSDMIADVYQVESNGSISFLQQVGPFPYGVNYVSMDTAHNNLYLGLTYTLGGTIAQICQYSINSVTGMLTPVNLNQSIFTAQSAGATFTATTTSIPLGSTVFSIAAGYVYSTQSATNYQAGNNPVTMAVH